MLRKKRKAIWLVVAAALWIWAAIVAGLIFPEIPALFSNTPTLSNFEGINNTAYTQIVKIELWVFIAFAVFVSFSNPSRKIWIVAGCLAVLLLLKTIWLAPLLDSNFHWQYPPLVYLPLIYTFTELVKFILLLLASYWLYSEITIITRIEERYRLFLATRRKSKTHYPNIG